jgi:predicted nucleic acid-binding protein
MRVLDASSALYAWDNYPIEQFPSLWLWLGSQIAAGDLQISSVAFEEVERKSPECAAWLETENVSVHNVDQEILLDAVRIKALLSIEGERFGGGVGENDLLIIAAARSKGAVLITDERRQPDLPRVKANYKIPAVCGLQTVEVSCLTFLEYLKKSKVIFG